MASYRTADKIMDEAVKLAESIKRDHKNDGDEGIYPKDAIQLADKVLELKKFMNDEFCVFYHP